MDSQDKLDEALRDLSPADEDMFDAFANKHLERAIQTVMDISQLLKEIKQELETCPGTPASAQDLSRVSVC